MPQVPPGSPFEEFFRDFFDRNRPPPGQQRPEQPQRPRRSMLAELGEGLRYLGREPRLRTLVILALVPMVFGMPYMTMLTVFASDVLHVGSGGLGLLTACSGAGAVCGALFVASRDETTRPYRLMLFGLVAFGLTLIGFAVSPWVWLSAPALLAVGFSQQSFLAVNNTLIQQDVDEEYRGRIVSTLFLSRSMVPLGTMLAGFGTAAFGVQHTMAAMAAALVLTGLLAARLSPAARDFD
jgi:predicted MFS family arabinose efflux permease